MFKKIISYALIFSILYPDFAFCMLDSEGEGSRKKITLSHDHLKNSTPLHEAPKDPEISQSLVGLKESHPSLITSKDTQESKLSSDDTMSDESQQDHSLSPSSKYSPPRADETLKDTSSQSDEISQENLSKNRSYSSHVSLSQSPNSTESGLTQSSEEENKHPTFPNDPLKSNHSQEKDDAIVSEQVPTVGKTTQNKEDCTTEKIISLPENPSTSPHQNRAKKAINPEQLPTSLDLVLEKFEKAIESEQTAENKQKTVVPEETVLTPTNPGTSLSEPLSLIPSLSTVSLRDSSPRENGQNSNSRRNSTDDASSDADSSQKKGNEAKSLLSEELKSSKLSNEDERDNEEENSSLHSKNEKVPFNFIGTWKTAQKAGKELYLRNPSERNGNTQANINETTGLLSKEKPFFDRKSNQGKSIELNSFESGGFGNERTIKPQQLGNKGNQTNEIGNPNTTDSQKSSQTFDKNLAQSLMGGTALKGEEADDEGSSESSHHQQDGQNVYENAGLLPSQERPKTSQAELLINEDQRESSVTVRFKYT